MFLFLNNKQLDHKVIKYYIDINKLDQFKYIYINNINRINNRIVSKFTSHASSQ